MLTFYKQRRERFALILPAIAELQFLYAVIEVIWADRGYRQSKTLPAHGGGKRKPFRKRRNRLRLELGTYPTQSSGPAVVTVVERSLQCRKHY
jgi:hypothetical protein